jgi:hypothetical protein
MLRLAQQNVWRPFKVIAGRETRTQRASRRRESDIWAEIVEAISELPTLRHSTTMGEFWR